MQKWEFYKGYIIIIPDEDETDSITDSMGMNLSKLWEIVTDTGVWTAVVHRVAKESDTTWLLKKSNNAKLLCTSLKTKLLNNFVLLLLAFWPILITDA